MPPRSRFIAALAWASAAFLFGLVLGERGELGLVQYAFLAGVPIVFITFAALMRKKSPVLLLYGLAMFAGVVLGQRSYSRAFEECRSTAPAVHAAIQRHTVTTGEFPQRLEDLGPLPCRATLRGSILHYATNQRTYRLWFTNERETHTATDKRGFARRPR